jgi:hypothetical protein
MFFGVIATPISFYFFSGVIPVPISFCSLFWLVSSPPIFLSFSHYDWCHLKCLLSTALLLGVKMNVFLKRIKKSTKNLYRRRLYCNTKLNLAEKEKNY